MIEMPKIFKGETVTIVGGGISLLGFDFKRVTGNVVSVNYSCYAVESDVLIALDAIFHKKNAEFLKDYKGYLVTDRKTVSENAIIIDQDYDMKKVNLSGFTALALTLYLGADKVYLLGFDGGYEGDRSDYYHTTKITEKHYSRVNKYYDKFKDSDITIFGNSKIESFKKLSLNKY